MNALRTSLLTLSLLASFSACGPADAYVDEAGDELMGLEAELTANSRFELFRGRDGQFYFHLRAGNGERILASEGYTTRSAAIAGINSVKANGTSERRFLFREARDGSHYFVLTATNGRIIGVSEMYVSKSNAERGAAALRTVVAAVLEQADAVPGTDRIELFTGIDKAHYFHVRAGNGQIVLRSQGYSSRSASTSAANSLKTNAAIESRYEVREAADGRFYFVVKASNGRVMGYSNLYVSKANAERGAEAVRALFVENKVEDKL
jgi:uncharacterized protein YegP (UPF0339 family)